MKRIVGLLGGKIQLGMIAQHPVERTVHVWDKPHVITVYQKSKCVWIAVGDYMGERIEVKGSSASSAAKWWADAARFKGNRVGLSRADHRRVRTRVFRHERRGGKPRY